MVLCWRRSVSRLSVRASVIICWKIHLLTWYLINRLWEFHQIYSFGAVGHKDELFGFWGQKVRGQGDSETTCSQISLLGGIFSLTSGMHRRILMNLVIIIPRQVHTTLIAFSRSWVERSRSETTSPKRHFFGRGIPIDCSLII